MRPLFTQERAAVSAGQFLDGLLGEERRKTGWMRAEAAGDAGPWRQQAVLGRGEWDGMRCATSCAIMLWRHWPILMLFWVLVLDETGFLKQGKASCGVGRQYTGSASKITNCQIGVFASYVSRHAGRMARAHVPDNTGFATKPALALALAMIERAIASNVPFSWVAADSVYGVSDIEMALKRAAKGYVLGVNANHPFRSWDKRLAVAGTAKDIAEALPEDGWQHLSVGEGTKGARLHDWTYLELADLDADDFDATFSGIWTRGLLIRRNIADGDLAFFSTWCPIGTSIETLVAVEGHRWAIEDSFEIAKNELGLDHNETRSWHGWHRHVSLVMLAFGMMATIRHHANAAPPQKTMRRTRH